MARAASKSAQGKHAKAGSKARETAPGKPQLKSAEGKGGERKNLEPQQARSRESLRKLLKAAAEVLGQHGIEGTTIPRIAAHAGLTPGAIYRRFDDKDALLETMILGILERQDERLRTGLTPEMAAQIPLPVLAEQVIHALVVSYRANARLMRSMRQFARTRVDTEFWKKACRLEVRSYERLVDLFLANANGMQHPDPKMAVSLGMMMVVSTLQELVLDTPEIRVWKGLMPQNDLPLKDELTRAFLSYLVAA